MSDDKPVHVKVTDKDGKPLGSWDTYADGRHVPSPSPDVRELVERLAYWYGQTISGNVVFVTQDNARLRDVLMDAMLEIERLSRQPASGTGDPDMPDLSLCSFNYLAAEMRKRGATVTPAPHGGNFEEAPPPSGGG